MNHPELRESLLNHPDLTPSPIFEGDHLPAYYHFKHDFPKVDQNTGGKWLIHDTKRHKDNQLQSLELPCRISQ